MSINAQYALGSSLLTFTSSRSTSNPATYIDSNGIIQVVTTSDVQRKDGGYYDATGFHAYGKDKWHIEVASTNLLTRTDGTSYSSGLWSGWSISTDTLTGTKIPTTEDNTAYVNIANTTSQRFLYIPSSGATGGNYSIISTDTAVGSVVNGNTLTVSCRIKSRTGIAGVTKVVLRIFFKDSAGTTLGTAATSSDIQTLITTEYRKFSFTATASNASTSRAAVEVISVEGLGAGDIFDIEVDTPQLEKLPYATSWIPTDVSSKTRNAEAMKATSASNRTAVEESIYIKFTPDATFANDNKYRTLITTDIKARSIYKHNTGTVIRSYPNDTDSTTVNKSCTTIPLVNVSYIHTSVYKHSSPYVNVYMNGTSEGTYTAGDWVNPAWGTYSYIGASALSINQLNGHIEELAIFNRAHSATEVEIVTKWLNKAI